MRSQHGISTGYVGEINKHNPIYVPYARQATRDPFYLDVGERILNDFIYRAKVDCGLCGIQDLRTNARDDRMESFALSETLKVGDHASFTMIAYFRNTVSLLVV